MSVVNDMGNKESMNEVQPNTADMSSTRGGDVLKLSASVRDNYKQSFQRAHKLNPSQSSHMKPQSSLQSDKNKPEETHSQQSPAQQPTSVLPPVTLNQGIVSQATEEFMQNYSSMQQPMLNSPRYVSTNAVFPGQMIQPMLLQQPMSLPTAMPGMFQTGFMYQTLTPGSAKPNSAMNSHHFHPFTKGSLIRLETGSLKAIEDLKTADFIESAKVSNQLCLETSTIVKIQDVPNSTMSLIAFAVDDSDGEVYVEKPSDYPFFIYEQGWASCRPDMTLSRYGLPCQKLKIGDVCIFLSNKLELRSDRTKDCEARSAVDDERQPQVNQYSSTSLPQNTENSLRDVQRVKETGEHSMSSDIESTKTQPKHFGKKEKDDSIGCGQPAGKKAKLDVPTKNIDSVKS